MTDIKYGPHSKPSQAIALKYDQITAPKLTAKGQSDLAEQIIHIAREHNIPIYENSELVNILSKLELGDEIPETLYQVIAEIIAFAYHLQGKVPKEFSAE
jgi:flagellar biosynthesis protein